MVLLLSLLSAPIVVYQQYASAFFHENLLGLDNSPPTTLTTPSVNRGSGSSLITPGYGGLGGLGYSSPGYGGLGGLGYGSPYGGFGGLGYGSGLLGILPALLGLGSSSFTPGSSLGYSMDYGSEYFDQGLGSEFQPSNDPFGLGSESDYGYDQSISEFQPSNDPFTSGSDSASFDQGLGSDNSEFSSYDTPVEDLRYADSFSSDDSFSGYESNDYFSETPVEDLRDIGSFP
ncbi:MAG: hypothetical protein M3227_01535 [Thermoproteota archaeon]|nr:hypothetical protein [Thermoproteota archaeon]